jgi:hypothetical protein
VFFKGCFVWGCMVQAAGRPKPAILNSLMGSELFFFGGGGGDTLGVEITVWGRDTLLRGELLKDSDPDWKCPHKNNHLYLDQTL